MSKSRVISLSTVVPLDQGNHYALTDAVLTAFNAAMRELQPKDISVTINVQVVDDDDDEDDDARG